MQDYENYSVLKSVDSKKLLMGKKKQKPGSGMVSHLRQRMFSVEQYTTNGASPPVPTRCMSDPGDCFLSSSAEANRWCAALNGGLAMRAAGGQEDIELNFLSPKKPHRFRTTRTERLTWCDFCGGPIVGAGRQAYQRCRGCHMTCHLECCKLVELSCEPPDHVPLLASPASSLPSPAVEDKNVLTAPEETSPVVLRRSSVTSSCSTGRFSLFSEGGLCPADRLSYDLSTLDRESIIQMGISVHDQDSLSPLEEVAANESATWSKEELRKRVEVFNDNTQGLLAALCEEAEDRVVCRGTVRVHMNLIRPIQLLTTARPPSIFDLVGPEDAEEQADVVGVSAFRLPRGTTKLVHVSSLTTTQEVIRCLLRKFRIDDNPHKFALYEHTIEGEREVSVRKLSSCESPLCLLLSWTEEGVDQFNQIIDVKRLVLQENETGDIDWPAFSVPELTSFLRILKREEDDYREQIRLTFELRRQEILRLLARLRNVDEPDSGQTPPAVLE